MHWSYRLNAVLFGILALGAAVLAGGFWPGDPGWTLCGGTASLLYVTIAVLLWQGVSWAGLVGMGAAGFSVGLWIQSLFALTVGVPASAATNTTLVTCLVCFMGSGLAFAGPCLIPRSVSFRHAASIAFAGAAVVPGMLFALAPSQALGVALAMGVGSVTLVAGTVAVARGRTWGLLLNLVGASIIGAGVMFAPRIGYLHTANPYIPNAAGFLVEVLGLSAAVLAAISALIYAGPVVRFLVRRD